MSDKNKFDMGFEVAGNDGGNDDDTAANDQANNNETPDQRSEEKQQKPSSQRTPAAAGTSTGEDTDDETPNERDEEIRDPEAYARSQEAMKYRLRAKEAETRLEKLEKQFDELQSVLGAQRGEEILEEIETLKSQVTDYSKQAKQAEQEAKQERIQRMRLEVANEHGLDAEMAEFITADDADGMQAQAEKLAERIGTPRAGRLGGGGNQQRSMAERLHERNKTRSQNSFWQDISSRGHE